MLRLAVGGDVKSINQSIDEFLGTAKMGSPQTKWHSF